MTTKSSLLSEIRYNFSCINPYLVLGLIIVSILIGIISAVLSYYILLIPLAIILIVIAVFSPSDAVLVLLALQSIAFHRTNEIDNLKIFYFVFNIVLILGWLINLFVSGNNKKRFSNLFRNSYSAIPLLVLMIIFFSTAIWLLFDPNYLIWIREFSLFTGYGLFFIVASSTKTVSSVKYMIIKLFWLSTLTAFTGIVFINTLPFQLSVNGQMNIIIVSLLGLSLYFYERNILLKIVYLSITILIPFLWLLPSFFSTDASEFSFVLALITSLLIYIIFVYLANPNMKLRVLSFLFICLLGITFYVAIYGSPSTGLNIETLEYTHRGSSFNLLNPMSAFDLPTMYLRIRELVVFPKYFLQSPIFGNGLTFGVPIEELYDAYGRNPKYFTGYLHNGYASMLLRIGLIGFIVFLWYLVSLIRDGWKAYNIYKHEKQESLIYMLGAILCSYVISIMIYSNLSSRFDDRGATTYMGILSGLVVVSIIRNKITSSNIDKS